MFESLSIPRVSLFIFTICIAGVETTGRAGGGIAGGRSDRQYHAGTASCTPGTNAYSDVYGRGKPGDSYGAGVRICQR